MAFGFGVIGFKMMAGARRRWNCNIGHGLDRSFEISYPWFQLNRSRLSFVCMAFVFFQASVSISRKQA